MVPNQRFPRNLVPDEHGVVAVGGSLDADFLMDAYAQGVFPWPQPGIHAPVWFSPDPRGVIPTDHIHASRSLRKCVNRMACRWTWNQNFSKVIRSCREIARPGQNGTWITEELMTAYIELFHRKRAYSLECWMSLNDQEEELVAGIYGVWMGRFVSGESMFSRVDNGSKAALLLLGTILQEHNVQFLDTQMVSEVVASMGGVEMDRNDFLAWVKEAFDQGPSVPEPDLVAAWARLRDRLRDRRPRPTGAE